MAIVPIDNQPICATFFHEGKWLTDFITPDEPDVKKKYQQVTNGSPTAEDRIKAMHQYVGRMKYKRFISGTMTVEGRVSRQDDLWNSPSVTMNIGVGNCSNKSFLLASLLRQEYSPDEVYVVLGNLHNGKVGGHAWVVLKQEGKNYIIESTRPDVPALVDAMVTNRYEAVHFFNDQQIYAVEGRTVMTPYAECFSPWLKNYLDWAYIEGRK